MKICMELWNAFPQDIRVRREASHLVKEGHEVTIVCRQSPDRPNRETIDGIDIIRVPGLSQPFSSLNELMLHFTLFDLRRYRCLSQIVKEENPDILHIHDLRAVRSGFRAAYKNEVPVVVDFHELYPESVKIWKKANSGIERFGPKATLESPRRWKKVEAKCMEKVRGTISESPEQLEYLRSTYDLSEVESAVVRNVPDTDRLGQIPIEPLGYDSYVVGYVGSFTPQRDLETVIKSFAQLLESVPEATLLMVGGRDNYANRLKKMCVDLGINDNVEFPGWVEFERIFSYMDASDVTLCTWTGNNIDSECTLPNKLFQSMFMQTPVVASDLRAMRSVVEETNCGLITQPESVSELTQALLKLHDDPELRRKMGENGKRAVEEKYNFGNEVENLISLYERVIRNER
jgi:glycosyltransferase involved in cell wall biosynthesis